MDQSVRSEFAVLHLDASQEKNFGVEVVSFEVEEALSSAFRVVVYFLSESANLPFDEIVNRGAAFSLYTVGAGQRVWAGVVTELELEHSEEHTGSANVLAQALAASGAGGPSYKGRSRYRMTIRPDLWRLSLRKNCRIFQKMTAAAIAKEVLKDWQIEVEEKLLETHPEYEYKVQYNETDFDFVSRILEDAGISYWIQPSPHVPITTKKKGSEVTKVIFKDQPHTEPSTYDAKEKVLPYMGDRVGMVHEHSPHIWMLSAFQQPRSLQISLRDRDFRGTPDKDPDGKSERQFEGRKGIELTYESFTFEHGVFWFDGQQGGDTPHADDRGVARISPDQQKKLPTRRFEAEHAGRMVVRFKTNAFDLEPGTVFQIGKDEFGYDNKHPHPAFAHDKKLLVIARTVVGRQVGDGYVSDCIAVYADEPYRPQRLTAKPRIVGVQSAVVVGPQGKEIYTDEFGRVRVQFPWDRYNKFDEKSSCWMRVSQMWAGGGFGSVAIPRIGHEVLVTFFDGDPDQPVIVGRVYNARTKYAYEPTGKSALGDNWTLTGIRTQISPHNGAYNELMFQDQPGNEKIHFQAQKDLSYVVGNVESHNVGKAVSWNIGQAESHDVGQSVAYKVGQSESHDIGQNFSVKVGNLAKKTEFTMTPTSIKLTTGDASIEIDADWIKANAKKEIHIHASDKVHLSSQTLVDVDAKKMTIDTQDTLELNCDEAKLCEAKAADAAPPSPPAGPSRPQSFPKPHLPAGGGPEPLEPSPLQHVTIGTDDSEEEESGAKPAGMLQENPLGSAMNAINQAQGAMNAGIGGAMGGAMGALGGGIPDLSGAVGGALPSFAGGLDGMMPNIAGFNPAEAQNWVRGSFGDQMPLQTLQQNFAAKLPDVGNGLGNIMNSMNAHVLPKVKEFLGNDFVQGVVTKMLELKGLPTSPQGLAGMAINKVVGKIGEDVQGTLGKAIFSGATDKLTTAIKSELPKDTFAAMLPKIFGGGGKGG